MIASLQNFLENARIETIILFTFMYLLILWLLVPTWVYLDAKKKFSQNWIPILLFIVILPLNIPGLIFYIIIRPEGNDLDGEVSYDDHVMNIPIVRFLDGKNDFVMSFEVKVNGDIIDKSRRKHLNMNVSIEPDDEAVEVYENKPEIIATDSEEKPKLLSLRQRVRENISKVKGFFIVEESESNDKEE